VCVCVYVCGRMTSVLIDEKVMAHVAHLTSETDVFSYLSMRVVNSKLNSILLHILFHH